VEFTAICGLPVCSYAYYEALGEPVQIPDSYQVGRVCVYPRLDWNAYKIFRGHDRPTLLKLLRSWIGASYAIFALDDPLPAIAHVIRQAIMATKKRVLPGSTEKGSRHV
jgi:hypothetical protein